MAICYTETGVLLEIFLRVAEVFSPFDGMEDQRISAQQYGVGNQIHRPNVSRRLPSDFRRLKARIMATTGQYSQMFGFRLSPRYDAENLKAVFFQNVPQLRIGNGIDVQSRTSSFSPHCSWRMRRCSCEIGLKCDVYPLEQPLHALFNVQDIRDADDDVRRPQACAQIRGGQPEA